MKLDFVEFCKTRRAEIGQLDSVVRELLQRTGAQRIGVHTGPLQQGQIYSGGMPIRLCVCVCLCYLTSTFSHLLEPSAR